MLFLSSEQQKKGLISILMQLNQAEKNVMFDIMLILVVERHWHHLGNSWTFREVSLQKQSKDILKLMMVVELTNEEEVWDIERAVF